MKEYETPTALLLSANKKLEKENKKLKKDIELAYMFITSGEVPKLTLDLSILEKALKESK